MLEGPNLRGSQTAEGIPQRRELAAQDVQVLPLLIQLRREPLSLAPRLLGLPEELVVLRSKAGEFRLPAGQLGASLVPLGASGRELAGEVVRLSLLPGGLLGRSRDFRLRVEPVEEVPSGTLVVGGPGRLDDVLDQEFVAAGAANVMTGQVPPDAQRHRTRRANHGDAIGVLLADVRPIRRKLLGGRRHQVRGKCAKLVLAMLALDEVAAPRVLDPQADEAVGANGHKVRGHLAHGSSSAFAGVEIRGAEGKNGNTAPAAGALLSIFVRETPGFQRTIDPAKLAWSEESAQSSGFRCASLGTGSMTEGLDRPLT